MEMVKERLPEPQRRKTHATIVSIFLKIGELKVAEEYEIRRQASSAGDEPWHLRVEGTLLRVFGGGRNIAIDLRRAPYRVQVSKDEMVIDMMRFSASPQAIHSVEQLLQQAKRATSPTEDAFRDDSGTHRNKLHPRSTTKYTAKFASFGGVAGLVVMFILPSGGSVLSSALIGAICGAGGCALGHAFGSFLDALATDVDRFDKTKKDWSSLSIVALILGIVGLIAWILSIVGIPIGIAGVVCGRKGASSSRRKVGLAGMGMSLVSLLLSVCNGLFGIILRIRAY